MLLNNYDYEIVRADEFRLEDFIWYLDKPCRIIEVATNEETTSFTVISGGGMYGTASFIRPNDEPQVKILNSGVLF